MRVYLILLIALSFNAAANILMKQSANAGSAAAGLIAKIFSASGLWFLSGLACFGLALIFYRWALETINLSIAYPIMTTLGYVIVILFSWLAFKEAINMKQVVGFVLILVGVVLVSMQNPTASLDNDTQNTASLPAGEESK